MKLGGSVGHPPMPYGWKYRRSSATYWLKAALEAATLVDHVEYVAPWQVQHRNAIHPGWKAGGCQRVACL
ncbi:hypothetical protein ABZX12_22670 [Kribbella sp. NPDC003505]|uniref:hypothetical protein n=1 Tax=Kribbella sp. NPDC003505 TaxID=3154448 RepID=UPI0033A02159